MWTNCLFNTALATPRGQKERGKVNTGSSHKIRMVPHSLEIILSTQTVVQRAKSEIDSQPPILPHLLEYLLRSSSVSSSSSNRGNPGGSPTTGTVGPLGAKTSGDSGMVCHFVSLVSLACWCVNCNISSLHFPRALGTACMFGVSRFPSWK